MAVSGSGGWVPSTLVCIHNNRLEQVGYTHNVPKTSVQMDMSVAADALRANPSATIRVDAKSVYRLVEYLNNTGHINGVC